jgi:hypothetical protein
MKEIDIIATGLFVITISIIGIINIPSNNNKISTKTTQHEIVHCAGDGNCLFRAISFHVNEPHLHVRRRIVKELHVNRENYIPFFTPASNTRNRGQPGRDMMDLNHETYDKYLANMLNAGVWGGEMELAAAAEVYRRPVIVYSRSIYNEISRYGERFSTPPIKIYYNGSSHYDAIRTT